MSTMIYFVCFWCLTLRGWGNALQGGGLSVLRGGGGGWEGKVGWITILIHVYSDLITFAVFTFAVFFLCWGNVLW